MTIHTFLDSRIHLSVKTFNPFQRDLKDLFGLKQGADLPVKVEFNGKPLVKAKVSATYAGFSDEPNAFAQTVETNTEGVATIKITQTGDWIVSVTHEIPYPDTKECDTHR